MSKPNNTAKLYKDMLSTLEDLGGRISTFDSWTGEVIRERGVVVPAVWMERAYSASTDGAEREDAPPARRRAKHAGLSTAHISPFIEYASGASLLKVSKGIQGEQVGGGKRQGIKGFSRGSRRRLMQTIARVRRDADLPCFITLTYPNEFPSPKESKRHLDIFLKRIKRAFPDIGIIWKLEPQERGAPHYHMLAWGVSEEKLIAYVPTAWHEIAGNDDIKHLLFHLGALGNQGCVSKVRSFRGVWSYASKYLGKTFDVAGWDEKPTGRFWAVVNRDCVPFGEILTVEIPHKKAVHIMRYQKRFAKLRRTSYPSLTTFCDAEQWIKNVTGEEVKNESESTKQNPLNISKGATSEKYQAGNGIIRQLDFINSKGATDEYNDNKSLSRS